MKAFPAIMEHLLFGDGTVFVVVPTFTESNKLYDRVARTYREAMGQLPPSDSIKMLAKGEGGVAGMGARKLIIAGFDNDALESLLESPWYREYVEPRRMPGSALLIFKDTGANEL